MKNYRVSQNCIDVIKHYEGFKAHPYLCPAGVASIGYGTTRYENGKPVSLKDQPITEAEGDELLRNDVAKFEHDVNSLLKVDVTQSQFDALVCFAYNVGSDIDSDDIAEGLGDSTLLKLVNQDIMKYDLDWKKKIAKQFNSWIWGKTKKGRVKLPGLIARRMTEGLMFTDNVVKFFN